MFKIEAFGIIDRMEDVRTFQTPEGKSKRCRTMVLYEGEGKWPKSIAVTFWGSDVDKLDGWRKGDVCVVTGRVQSREVQRRDGGSYWTTSIAGFDIQPVQPDGATVEPLPPEPFDDGVTLD